MKTIDDFELGSDIYQKKVEINFFLANLLNFDAISRKQKIYKYILEILIEICNKQKVKGVDRLQRFIIL